MTIDPLAYETLLLTVVAAAVLLAIWKSRESKGLLWLFFGLLVIIVSRSYTLAVGEESYFAFYLTSAAGYLIVAISAVRFANYLRSVKSLERTALYDPLTGAYNRNFIEEYIEEEIKKAKRLKEEFCILLVDLNDFKAVNDTYGHNAGDQVLKRVVRELKKHLREYDMIARWGGDEFLIVLPAEKQTNILEVADRLVGNFVVCYKDIKVTLSLGYACFPVDGSSLSELIEVADIRMYRSKKIFKEAKKYALDDKSQEKV